MVVVDDKLFLQLKNKRKISKFYHTFLDGFSAWDGTHGKHQFFLCNPTFVVKITANILVDPKITIWTNFLLNSWARD